MADEKFAGDLATSKIFDDEIWTSDPVGLDSNHEAKWTTNSVDLDSNDDGQPHHHVQRTLGFSIKGLQVDGTYNPGNYQRNVGDVVTDVGNILRYFTGTGKRKICILKDINGLVPSGQMLLVLGRPGSGCSTLLKTISGDTYGLSVHKHSQINYEGITPLQMSKHFRGEAIYMAETDVHFPQLTVGQTLLFAAKASASESEDSASMTWEQRAQHRRDDIAETLGLSHVMDTNVGNDTMKGVSGGERKRVSIAEAILSRSCLQCWDNSTRGLDSANALEFCRVLRASAHDVGTTSCVTIYQCPQQIYRVSSSGKFDRCITLTRL